MIDDEDYEWITDLKGWRINTKGYVQITKVRSKKGYFRSTLGRMVMFAPRGKKVDHRDGNPLNNQKYNLRICTMSKNNMNRRKSKNRSSIYKGVCWYKRTKRWKAAIGKDYKQFHIGFFQTEVSAAIAYDLWAIDLHGAFAKTNFEPVIH